MPWLALAGISALGSITGGLIAKSGAERAAEAAGAAGEAQLQAAREEIAFARERLRKEINERRRIQEMAMASAIKSPTEIAAIDRIIRVSEESFNLQKGQIDKQLALLETVDPAIKEAGGQLYSLMKGESTKMLEPVMKNRQIQKQKLEAQLSRTLGPGFRTSSAGIQAINNFDLGTDSLVYETQNAAIQRAQNVYLAGMQTRAQVQAGLGAPYRDVMAAQQAAAGIEEAAKRREVSAILGVPAAAPINFGALQQAAQSVTAAAGAPYAGEILAGQAQAGLGGAIMGMGGKLLGQAAGGMMLGDIFGKESEGLSLRELADINAFTELTQQGVPNVEPQFGSTIGSLFGK